jgi:peptide-methionine (R)-S-oxide reductase
MKYSFFLIAVLLTAAGCKGQRNNGMVESKPMANPNEMTGHENNPYYSRTDTTPLRLSDEEWKKVLPDSIYEVCRKKGTEYAFLLLRGVWQSLVSLRLEVCIELWMA